MITLYKVLTFALLATLFGCDEQLILKNAYPVIDEVNLLVAECGEEQLTYLV